MRCCCAGGWSVISVKLPEGRSRANSGRACIRRLVVGVVEAPAGDGAGDAPVLRVDVHESFVDGTVVGEHIADLAGGLSMTSSLRIEAIGTAGQAATMQNACPSGSVRTVHRFSPG